MIAIDNYKIDQHITPIHGQSLSHSVCLHPDRKFGWKERVIERVVTAETKGVAYQIFVKSLAIFTCLVLGLSIIGSPIALWSVCEYTSQVYEGRMRTERKEMQNACASRAHFISMSIEKLRPQLIDRLGFSDDEAKKWETGPLLRQTLTKFPDYLLGQFHPDRKFGWKERIIERVIAAETKGLTHKICIRALSVFACLLLGMSIIGLPIAIWSVCEYTRQSYEGRMRVERKEMQKACASHANFISLSIEKS